MLPVVISVRSNICHSKVSKLYLLCGKKIYDKKGKLFCLRCAAESNFYDTNKNVLLVCQVMKRKADLDGTLLYNMEMSLILKF